MILKMLINEFDIRLLRANIEFLKRDVKYQKESGAKKK